MGEVIGLIILIIVSVVASAVKKKNKGALSEILSEISSDESPGEEAVRTEKARKFFDNERRKQAFANSLGASAADERPAASPAYTETRTVRDDKPIIGHSSADCTGGSIHDGYHEGTAWKQGRPMPRRMPETAPEGVPAKGEEHSIRFKEAEAAQRNASGAEKLTALISEKPSIVQGVIWSEVLGRPVSEHDITR